MILFVFEFLLHEIRFHEIVLQNFDEPVPLYAFPRGRNCVFSLDCAVQFEMGIRGIRMNCGRDCNTPG
jgi:hypothetical protein